MEEKGRELFLHYKIIVDPGQDLLRLDKFLMDRVANITRNKLQNYINDNYIFVNDIIKKPNYRVKPNDIIKIKLPYPVPDKEIIPENIPLDIVYEDDDLIVINKKSNMLVHPGFGHKTGTLANALVYHYNNLPNRDEDSMRPGIVHRLDKNTTGLIVVAKNIESLRNLTNQFAKRKTGRTYHAIVWGTPKESEGKIIGHIGRSTKDRKIYRVFEDGSQGRWAATNYKVLESYTHTSLIECKLETGRTHQIRVHLKHIGHTLFNDEEYGGDKILRGENTNSYRKFIKNCYEIMPYLGLHAKTLSFVHPKTKNLLEFNSSIPDNYKQLIEKLKNY